MNHGARLEKFLDRQHGLYRSQGLAEIVKVPNPTKQTRKGGKVTFHRTSPVWVDYAGALKGGTAVALEAKYTSVQGLSFPLSAIRPNQRRVLTSVHAMGGVSALYIRRGHTVGRRLAMDDYLVPAEHIDGLAKKSFRWTDVKKYRVQPGAWWLDALSPHHGGWDAYQGGGWPG